MTSRASVIVRCLNEVAIVERTLQSLHAQTVRPEIVFVDSGSGDGSLAVAERYADHIVHIPAGQFTYGRALNAGARAAGAPVHFALSAHCFAPPHWVEGALAHYGDPQVAGTNGIETLADGTRVTTPFRQGAEHAHANPWWGFSNHASSWRADVWKEFPFNEEMDYAEDREWALRVTAAGFEIVYDPALWVDLSHAWRGWRELFTRQRRASRAVAGLTGATPYGIRGLARDWWADIPDDRHTATAHRFVNFRRLAGLAGRYAGRRQARLDVDRAGARVQDGRAGAAVEHDAQPPAPP